MPQAFLKQVSFIFLISVPVFAQMRAPVCTNSNSQATVNPDSGFDFSSLDISGMSPNELYAQKLYQKLTGGPAQVQNPHYKRVVQMVSENKYLEAAQAIVSQEKNFLQVRARNFAAPFSSKDFSPTEPFNDLQALIVGVIRDQLDARLILTGDLRYSGYANLGLPPVALDNNNHYQAFDDRQLSYQFDLEMVSKQWDGSNPGLNVGAFTTRAWAKVAYDAGTNRRSLKNAFEYFMCAPIDSWKFRGVPDMFVRRDVNRLDGDNPSIYQNTCRSCHAIMDGMAGSFAKLDFVTQKLTYTADGVTPKYNQNGNVYPAGYVTVDDSWTNMLDYNTTVDFGWRTAKAGQGVKEFANMLAQSSGYSHCLVKRVYNEVCGQALVDAAPELLEPMTKDFETKAYNLQYLFAKVAAQPSCVSQPRSLE